MGKKVKETVRKEFEVAFSKDAQPVWFRITKWVTYMGLACCMGLDGFLGVDDWNSCSRFDYAASR